MATLLRQIDGLLTNISQMASDFVGQHLLQSQPEEMRSIAAVRPGGDVAAYACGASRAPMAQRTTIRQTSANRIVGVKVAYPVSFIWALSLLASKLALEELAPATDRTKGIAAD